MAKERRDSKNRVLWKGEYQKADGRYMYRYTDINGKTCFVYSWTLTKTDRVPKGKAGGPCLRDLEKEIAKDLHDEIDTTAAKKVTLNEYFEKYMSLKMGLKPSTRRNYRIYYDSYVRDRIGGRRLASLKYSDIKGLYMDLHFKQNLQVATILGVNTILHPIFTTAVRDGLIRSNPVTGVASELKKSAKSMPEKRHPLTKQQQEAFIEYVKDQWRFSHWLPIFTFLLGTGCRVGEMVGLTWDDCDFDKNVIRITHNMAYLADEITGVSSHVTSSPKTRAGIREIPMLNDVRNMLWQERLRQTLHGFSATNIDGYSGFVFINRRNNVYSGKDINIAIKRIVASYNKDEQSLAEIQKREPVFLPHFTAHHLRHTFCTRLCEVESDVKVIQEIMGHSSIRVTMDIYNEVSQERKIDSIKNHEGKFKIC